MATINGTNGNNTLIGTNGNDIINGLAGNDRLFGRRGNDILIGGTGRDALFGEAGNDSLGGGTGNDLLNGGLGADFMSGGAGNDLYFVDNRGDRVGESSNAGIDTVRSTVSLTLSSEVENLVLLGTRALNGFGNDEDNRITGNNAANLLSFARDGFGDDTLLGLGGNDRLFGGQDDDKLFGGAGNDRLEGGDEDDRLYGGAGNDVLVGGDLRTLGNGSRRRAVFWRWRREGRALAWLASRCAQRRRHGRYMALAP
jgi:Ca2+-binding RTX toxin-like protein